MKWIMAIITSIVTAALQAIFGTTPEERREKKQEKKLTKWQTELEGLQGEEQQAGDAWRKHVASWHSTDDPADGRGAVLHAQWSAACEALRIHRLHKPSQ